MCSNVPDGRLERRRMPADEVLVELMLVTRSRWEGSSNSILQLHTPSHCDCDEVGGNTTAKNLPLLARSFFDDFISSSHIIERQHLMMLSKSSKRRKTATTYPLYDLLPGGILKEVAKFLAPTSRILLAIAITHHSSQQSVRHHAGSMPA
eukprot:scaffold5893_cov106-Skeletonema_marinoi.AAC.5